MNMFFECDMGASGDMLSSALIDLFDDKEKTVEELNSIGFSHTVIKYERGEQCGIDAAHIRVLINGEEEKPNDEEHHIRHHHHSRGLNDIIELINTLNVSDKVKADAISIYNIIAEAEAKAHNKEVGEIHFHELGMLDAVADVTMAAYMINELCPQRIIVSPINAGGGSVKCAHGVLPVPAPATANILIGMPYYKSDIKTELCTPTGAAILKYYASEFAEKPNFGAVEKIGIGMGTKKLERANILRAFLFKEEESITELSCNIDDMTGEEAGYAAEVMMKAGALDCFITPIMMKKGRPAFMITVLCKNEECEKFASLIFKHTSTIGIRKYIPSRYTLDREFKNNQGALIKRSQGYGVIKEKTEFEQIKALAEEKGISVFEARRYIEKNTDF